MEIKKYIIVTWQFEGFHLWPLAPNETAFLRFRHRHLFKCLAKISVNHHDREIEFFSAKKILEHTGQPVEGSCEEMAEYFLKLISRTYGEREIMVEVWEDGENAGVAST